jgi:DNA-binding MarR family transcriptional regulator
VLNEPEGLGLASRQRDTADRRRHIVTITPKGAEALQAVDSVLDTTDDDLFAALSPKSGISSGDGASLSFRPFMIV